MGNCFSISFEDEAAGHKKGKGGNSGSSAQNRGKSGGHSGSSKGTSSSLSDSTANSEALKSQNGLDSGRDASLNVSITHDPPSSDALRAPGDSARVHPQSRSFTFKELQKMTKNFHRVGLLGEGGFGPVYRGRLEDGQEVAVKVLNSEGGQGHREWEAEVRILSQLNHPHLVRLVGFCAEGEHKELVYEFMPNGSLDNWLFHTGKRLLSWDTRMKIALHAARGLAFLHGCPQSIIFRDLKASNVLLDQDLNAKLSDFGLARSGPQGNASHVSTRVMGTKGYAAPEYVYTGHLTVKSDVYTYGVVLLELLTGRPALDPNLPASEQSLVDCVRPQLSDKSKFQQVVDKRLKGQFSQRALRRIVVLALNCLRKDANTRPTMVEIAKWLEPVQGLYEQEQEQQKQKQT